MKTITQKNIFDYTEIEELGDLERLNLALINFGAESIITKLENERGNGRNDWPIQTMFNLTIAMKVLGHRSVESFRRELLRNSQLRKLCGLKDYEYKYFNKHLVPKPRVFTNFIKKLAKYNDDLENLFLSHVKDFYDIFEDFGINLAFDGKIIETYANKNNDLNSKDLRAEHEAEKTAKTYYMKDGSKKTHWFFGYRANILCDSKYGLPVYNILESANKSEQKNLDKIIEQLDCDKYKYILDKCENLTADAGLDNGIRNKLLKEQYNINPIIDIRYMWSKDEEYRDVPNQELCYNESGEVFYIKDINSKDFISLKPLGFDKSRKALRYSDGEKTYRVPLSTDYRIFTPIARDTMKWKRLYKMRTEVERLNARLDRDYMFNDHFIRGKSKMKLMVSLSFITMYAMAKGHISKKQHNLRSLVKV